MNTATASYSTVSLSWAEAELIMLRDESILWCQRCGQQSICESCHAESIKYPAGTEFVQIFCLED